MNQHSLTALADVLTAAEVMKVIQLAMAQGQVTSFQTCEKKINQNCTTKLFSYICCLSLLTKLQYIRPQQTRQSTGKLLTPDHQTSWCQDHNAGVLQTVNKMTKESNPMQPVRIVRKEPCILICQYVNPTIDILSSSPSRTW